jgi:shikimate kinase
VKKRNIVLVGFMGTGKSTVGRALAERLEWAFLDTDEYLERKHNRSIPEMFRDEGEAYFRAAESEALLEVLSGESRILATGGGAVLAAKNREMMQKNGFVIALHASPDVIIRRVSSDQNRPLLQGNIEERVHAIMEQRKNAYDFANFRIDTSGLSVPEIVERILEAVNH